MSLSRSLAALVLVLSCGGCKSEPPPPAVPSSLAQVTLANLGEDQETQSLSLTVQITNPADSVLTFDHMAFTFHGAGGETHETSEPQFGRSKFEVPPRESVTVTMTCPRDTVPQPVRLEVVLSREGEQLGDVYEVLVAMPAAGAVE